MAVLNFVFKKETVLFIYGILCRTLHSTTFYKSCICDIIQMDHAYNYDILLDTYYVCQTTRPVELN